MEMEELTQDEVLFNDDELLASLPLDKQELLKGADNCDCTGDCNSQ